MTEHSIQLLSNESICPICQGMLKKTYTENDTVYFCNDCKQRFVVCRCGKTDREIEIKELADGGN